jgi:hypothetical protein
MWWKADPSEALKLSGEMLKDKEPNLLKIAVEARL